MAASAQRSRRASQRAVFGGFAARPPGGQPGLSSPTTPPPFPLSLQAGSYALNAGRKKKERVGRLMQMHANSREDVKKAFAGDIVAVAGLKVGGAGLQGEVG